MSPVPASGDSRELWAFVDEAGDRGLSERATDHFVLTAVVVRASNLPRLNDSIAELRAKTGRQPGEVLHWRKMRDPHRSLAASELGQMPLRVVSVIVCKRHLTGLETEERMYLFALRLLLERMSWLARAHRCSLHYVLAHIVRFRLSTLREYEDRLRRIETQIHWPAIAAPGHIDQPSRGEQLQIADVAASAVFRAFEPTSDGATNPNYRRSFGPLLYRNNTSPIWSYGLKLLPFSRDYLTRHPWIHDL